MHRFSFLVRCFLLVLSLLTIATRVCAGGGKIVNGKLNILVYFAYDEKNQDSWQPMFKEFSKLLYNATEKQLQLGTVTFTNCRQLRNRADVWVLNDNSGARAHVNGLGKSGLHITISQTHKSTSGAALGHFGLTHEAGHYLFGILDEYKGYVGNVKQRDAKHFCVTDASGTCCIMDGGTTIAGNNGRTEFCTTAFASTKHNKGENNAAGKAIKNNQEYFKGKSCWATIKASGRGLSEPTAEPKNDAAGLAAVIFKKVAGQLALAMVIDRSGSMSGTRIALAKQGASLGVGVMSDGEFLSIVSFSSSARVDMSMRKIDAVSRAAAIGAIGGLNAGGGTSISRGLTTGQSQLDTVEGCAEIIILLSDGISNVSGSTIASLKAKGTVVYSIGLGTGVNVSLLTSIATGTGGKFFSAPTGAALPLIFQKILLEVQGGITLGEAEQRSLAGGASEDHKVTVSSFADEIIFSVGHSSGTLALTLKNPAGEEINLVNWAKFAGVTFRSSGTQQVYTVKRPAKGEWTSTVRNTGGSATRYDLIASSLSSRISLAADLGATAVRYPAPIPVSVAVSAGWQVTGASVQATVRGPKGVVLPEKLSLFDDGKVVHGDQYPGDGIYNALFSGYKSGSGSYTFDIAVVNLTGKASTFTECPPCYTGLEEGASPISVPPFQGSVSGSQSVLAVPGTIPTGSLMLADANPKLNGQTVNGVNPDRTVVLDIELTASPAESVLLETVEIIKSAGAGLDQLGELELHIDKPDATTGQTDGVVDNPSVPIATAKFAANKLVIDEAGGFVRIPANKSVRLLVTVGNDQIARARGVLPPPGGGGTFWPRFWPILVILPLLLLFWVGRRRKRVARIIPIRARWAAAAALFLVVALGVGSCKGSSGGGGGGGPTPPTLAGAMTLSFLPATVKATGASSGQSITTTGPDIQVTTIFN